MGREPSLSRQSRREIVLKFLQGDESCAALAAKHGVSDQTIFHWQPVRNR
jgi:transposase-like protein